MPRVGRQRGGQPRTGQIANNRLVVLLDDGEWAEVRGLAVAAGISRSEYVRSLLRGAKSMNVADYQQRIVEIAKSNLPRPERDQALELTAQEIDGCAWQSHAKEAAREVAAVARAQKSGLPYDGLAAMDALAAKGMLSAKRGV